MLKSLFFHHYDRTLVHKGIIVSCAVKKYLFQFNWSKIPLLNDFVVKGMRLFSSQRSFVRI